LVQHEDVIFFHVGEKKTQALFFSNSCM
jgi:hypothetical protein